MPPVVRTRVVALLASAGVAAALIAGSAHATTGAGAGLPAPKTHIDPGVMGPFVGLYELSRVERRAKIISSEIAIDYTELPPQYPIGRIAIRSYDAEGRQSSFQATLYGFTGEKDVHANILSQGDNALIGGLTLRNPTVAGVEGTLELDGEKYEVAYKRFDDDDGPPEATRVVQTGPRFVRATDPGWGPAASAAGTWNIVNGSPDPGAGSGVFASVVRLARTVGTGTNGAPTGGSLKVVDASGKQSATLDVQRPGGLQRLFLTDLKSGGSSRSAVVHSGSAGGPAVGTLKGTFTSGELDLTLDVDGHKTDLVLQRTAAAG